MLKLCDLVVHSARSYPDALAINAPDTNLTYSELDKLASRLARALVDLGICRSDRVGIWLDKSACAIVVMQAVLRLRAIYVPLDPLSPATRIRTILHDSEMRVVVTTQKRAQEIHCDDLHPIVCLCVDGDRSGFHWDQVSTFSDLPVCRSTPDEDEIAYILYTSGSTGKPKGVCISNQNALAFIEWATSTLQVTSSDRFANHAPFHFDLSVLDLYGAFEVGATVFLIPDGTSYIPNQLVHFVIEEMPTVWYSVPSAIILMMEQGGFLAIHSLSLRFLLFAGETFPLKHLRKLCIHYPTIRVLNLYGPTETNVCTFYEVRGILEQQKTPIPIGKACSGDYVWALKDDGCTVLPGEEGELLVAGPTVMIGYWGQPPQGDKPYATGDLVRLQEDGNYVYIGRRDQMVKLRGHRIELGDIEMALEKHPALHEVAVLVVGASLDARLVAFVVPTGDVVPSLLEMKRHCAERLPRYMIIDEVRAISALPRSRNGKIDRLLLSQNNDRSL